MTEPKKENVPTQFKPQKQNTITICGYKMTEPEKIEGPTWIDPKKVLQFKTQKQNTFTVCGENISELTIKYHPGHGVAPIEGWSVIVFLKNGKEFETEVMSYEKCQSVVNSMRKHDHTIVNPSARLCTLL